jgi:hypothetical protein
MTMSGSEFDLAVACCRKAFAGSSEKEVCDLSKEIDWPHFLNLARRHRIQGIVSQALKESNIKAPAHVADVLSADTTRIVEQNLRMAAESAALLQHFSSADLPLLFLKGLTLGALAYRNPILKMGWDVDVLVAPDAAIPAAQLLSARGFVLHTPSVEPHSESFATWHRQAKESVWWRQDDDIYVELHTRAADNAALIPALDVHAQTQQVEVLPGVTLPTFATDELFAYLAVHGASSAWFRLKWIADFSALLLPLDSKKIEQLYDKSQELGAGRAGAQALLLAHTIFGIPLGEELLAELLKDRMNRSLAAAAYRQLLNDREPTGRMLGTFSIHASQFFMLPWVEIRDRRASGASWRISCTASACYSELHLSQPPMSGIKNGMPEASS